MIRAVFPVAGALLVAGAAVSEPVVFTSPRPGETLQGGQVVEIRFEGVPADVEEFELLLGAGPGSAITFRLTEMLDPATRAFFWTVPNLSLPEATLRLRMGQDEVEVESVPSEPFAIETSRSESAASLDFRRGELWVATETGGELLPYSLPGLDMTPLRFVEWRQDRAMILVPDRTPAAPEHVDRGIAPPSAVTSELGLPDRDSHSRAPRDVPRRI